MESENSYLPDEVYYLTKVLKEYALDKNQVSLIDSSKISLRKCQICKEPVGEQCFRIGSDKTSFFHVHKLCLDNVFVIQAIGTFERWSDVERVKWRDKYVSKLRDLY